MHTPVLGFEGGVAAGKTAAARQISSLGYSHIPDYMSFISPSIHHIIGGWPQSFRLRFFADIELVRTQAALDQSAIVLDRTFLTIFAHDFARKKMGVDIDADAYVQLDPYRILWPRQLVFFDVDDAVRQSRLSTRGFLGDTYFTDAEFNNALRSFFELIATSIPTLWIDTTQLVLTDVVRLIEKTQNTDCLPPSDALQLYRFALEVLQDA